MQNLINEIQKYQAVNMQEEADKKLLLEILENANDDIFTRENKVMHFTASCWVTNQKHDKILMAYHNIYDSWAWLGGHADGNHNLLEVALKEAKEESGLKNIQILSKDITSLEILDVKGHVKHGEYVSAHLHLNLTYLLVADENEKLQNKEDENSAVAWFDIDEAPKMASEIWFRDNIYSKLNARIKNFQ